MGRTGHFQSSTAMSITNGEFQVQPAQEGLSHGGLILQRSSQSHLDWQQLPGSNFPTVVHSLGKVQHWAKCTVGSWWLVEPPKTPPGQISFRGHGWPTSESTDVLGRRVEQGFAVSYRDQYPMLAEHSTPFEDPQLANLPLILSSRGKAMGNSGRGPGFELVLSSTP